MELIADGLLIATALTAALYCLVLSRRLSRLTDAEAGIGTQIQSLSRALDETRAGLAETRRGVAEARGSARNATESLGREVERARQTLAELARAHTQALDALGRFDRDGEGDGGTPTARRQAPRAVLPDVPGNPPSDDASPSDDIPDWPDGVVLMPDESVVGDAFKPDGGADGPAGTGEPGPMAGAEPASAVRAGRRDGAAGSGAPLRVERMAL